MNAEEFAARIILIGKSYGGSITSWGRTDKRSVAVGGFAKDPHTWWLGADMVYDDGPNRPGSEGHPRFPKSCPVCSGQSDLKVIHEKGCDHYQPLDFPAGPVKTYDGVTRLP